MSKAVLCPVCKGCGKVGDLGHKCHGCKGNGWVTVGDGPPTPTLPIYSEPNPCWPYYPYLIYPTVTWTTSSTTNLPDTIEQDGIVYRREK